MPNEVKGGTFAPADMKLIKKALNVYLEKIIKEERDSEDRNPEVNPEIQHASNLLHRIGRIDR